MAYFAIPHRIGFSSCSGVPVGLFGKPKRSTSSRFAASIEAHRDVFSETLMFQVRLAHPPNCAPSYLFFVLFSKTHDLQVRFALPPNCAPKPSFRRFRCSAWLILQFRTESAFQAAPVFRSAYSASRNTRPPAASRPPNPAPSYRFFSVSRRSRLRGCRHRAESTHHLTPSGCVPSGGAGAPPAPPLPPPSRCRPDRFKGSP